MFECVSRETAIIPRVAVLSENLENREPWDSLSEYQKEDRFDHYWHLFGF